MKAKKYFGFDRKQVLYFLVDIAINSLQHEVGGSPQSRRKVIMFQNSRPIRSLLQYQIYRGKWPKEQRLLALKTLYTRKVKIPTNMNTNANVDTNVNHDSFLYELNFEKLREHKDFAHDDKQFKEEVLDKLEFIITVDEQTQTEEAN